MARYETANGIMVIETKSVPNTTGRNSHVKTHVERKAYWKATGEPVPHSEYVKIQLDEATGANGVRLLD